MISIVAAAQKMMTRVLVEEARGTAVRVYSVIAFDPVKTRDRRHEVVEEWLAPEDLGGYVARLHLSTAQKLDEPVHVLHTIGDLR